MECRKKAIKGMNIVCDLPSTHLPTTPSAEIIMKIPE